MAAGHHNAAPKARYRQFMQWGKSAARTLFIQNGLEGLAVEAALHLDQTRPLSTEELAAQVDIPRSSLLYAIQARTVESEYDPEAYAPDSTAGTQTYTMRVIPSR